MFKKFDNCIQWHIHTKHKAKQIISLQIVKKWLHVFLVVLHFYCFYTETYFTDLL